MSALAQLSKFIDRFNTFIGYLCAFFVFSMVIVVFTVVVLRYGFNIGFIWMQEVYVWLHSFVFMLGAGFTYLANEHVRIDVFYREASKKYKATVDLFGNIFSNIIIFYMKSETNYTQSKHSFFCPLLMTQVDTVLLLSPLFLFSFVFHFPCHALPSLLSFVFCYLLSAAVL